MTDKIEVTGQDNPVSEELVEAFARVLCVVDDCDPDQLEPGNSPYCDNRIAVDGELNGDVAFFIWRLYDYRARAILTSPAYLAELQAAWRRGMEEAVGIVDAKADDHARRANNADVFGYLDAGVGERDKERVFRNLAQAILSRMEKKS